MLKIQNQHVDWQHRWIRILKENSKSEVARVIPFERGSRLEEVLRRRAFFGPEAYVFGHAKTGEYVGSFRSAWGRRSAFGRRSWPAGHGSTAGTTKGTLTQCGTTRSLAARSIWQT